MAINAQNQAAIVAAVSHLDEFAIGTMRGRWFPDATYADPGRLGAGNRAALAASQGIIYVIYSYATPIAWRSAGATWVVPDARYSVTSNQHLSLVRQGIAERDRRIAGALASVGINPPQ